MGAYSRRRKHHVRLGAGRCWQRRDRLQRRFIGVQVSACIWTRAGRRFRQPTGKGGCVLDGRFALPTDTVLDGAYRIVRVVGTGGFGITYEAEDIKLGTTVALKEYYPDEFGDRDARMSVRPKSERHKQTFEWGRSNFLKEARTLARFEHPSIVRVTRVFEAHSTAYMVMSFERGQSFEAWLDGPRPAADAGRARRHRRPAARRAAADARGRLPASRHRPRQHHRARRRHSRAARFRRRAPCGRRDEPRT